MKNNERVIIRMISRPEEDPQVIFITEKLNAALKAISGSDGANNASLADFAADGACFLLLLCGQEIIGCGGYRPLNERCAEIKRMYIAEPGRGLGSRLLQTLEARAACAGFQTIRLETRRINAVAVNFYLRNGYRIIDNYGVYRESPEALCFEKNITA